MAEHGRQRMKDIFIVKQKEDKIEQAPSDAKAKEKALEQPERKNKWKETREKVKTLEHITSGRVSVFNFCKVMKRIFSISIMPSLTEIACSYIIDAGL